MRVVGLDSQKSLRDLAGLPRVCDDVGWLEAEALADAPEPAVIVGLWLFEEPTAARRLLEKRAAAGGVTIVVPRFRAGDLKTVLQAPSSVRVKVGDFDSFELEDGTELPLPGQTVVETPLHTGQWGDVAGLGVTVLGYRPHEGAAAIVLCTAGLASRRFGVDAAQQKLLLGRIVDRATVKNATGKAMATKTELIQPAGSIEELLLADDSDAAAVALVLAVNGATRDSASVATTARQLGFELTSESIARTLVRMPEASAEEMEAALKQHGWGAFLRRSRMILAEGGEA
ncbi:hypothetical protein Mal4_19560 [Maioricimonas rarisocia]|uniref:Uncharacterized protein n=1 Tax=Maioricimonas rarisocia TaxID=2528026 RepID=A0A517Z5C0_9PLAN|nr:hypothetical protein [Maioricimonas rarisocia]QDU37641.1 hypothetical protein Mal4_19560 [Maioricimonas rarisocia]